MSADEMGISPRHRLAAPIGIIINADDLGISQHVNCTIFDLIESQHITSASMLANGAAIEEAAQRASEYPECSFGVHLNVTEFKPLSAAGAQVLTRNGEMSRRHLEEVRLTPALLRAVYEEFCSQIQKLLSFGIPLSHIDSHQHAHTIPRLFPVLKAVQRRFGIRRIRASRNIYSASEPASPGLLMKKRLFNCGLRRIYASRVTDAFTDLPTLLKINPAELRGYRSIEVMVHPGAPGRADETAILRSPWMESLRFTGRTLNYRQL